MEEYWKKVHDDALARMRALVAGNVVKDNCDDMRCALAYVMKHGSCKDAAEAMDAFVDYKWAMHEMAAHSSAPMAMK